jgi:hypothetical protein
MRGPNDNDPAPSSAEGAYLLAQLFRIGALPWVGQARQRLTPLLCRRWAANSATTTAIRAMATCLYGTSGTTDDYTYGKLGVSSYTFEIGQNFF